MSDAKSDPLLIPVLSASNFVIGMGAFLVVGMLTPIATSLDISAATAGQIMTVYAIAYAILSPLLVAMTGAIGRRRVLAAGLCLFALGAALAAVSSSTLGLNLSRLFAAAGAGLFTPVAAATAAGLSSEATRGRVLAAVFFGLTLAQVVGVPAGSYIAYTFGWRWAFWLVVALALPCIALVWMRVPKGLSFQATKLSDLAQVMKNGPLMLAILFTASFLGAIYVVFTYLAPMLEDLMGFGRDGITLALLIFGAGAVVGNILGGILADKLGPARTLLLVAIGQAAIMPAFSFLPMPPWVVFAIIALWSVVGWSFMASQQSRLIARAPEAASVVLALNAASIYVGAAAGSAAGGLVLATAGPSGLGVAAGLFMLGAVAHVIASNRA
ncbi:putative MFS family arabinose efflux permease [Litoreibacter ponti]|uniref:Putative MFS family arabinose efflux permease n=1 Tax=Litoreibacter ponti TaxID=1510457 RepID=A0A2T6BDH5_9RHOB|nr:MFS transporter [Litoreibacter ponti]PTX54113.1 putative MFS family arabinose efflux permease [Litoreibacter ponti]